MRNPIHTAAQDRFLALLSGARNSAELIQAEVAGRLKKPQRFVANTRRASGASTCSSSWRRAIEADPVDIVREIACYRLRWGRSRKSGRTGKASLLEPRQ